MALPWKLLIVVILFRFLPTPTLLASSDTIVCQVDGQPMQTFRKIAGIAANTNVLLDQSKVETFAQMMEDAGIKKTTRSLRWDRIETTKGNYQWNNVSTGEGLSDSATQALPADTIIFKPGLTPIWASRNPNALQFNNTPPTDIDDWRAFITAAVTRYGHGSGGAKKVKDWEIWNEPNVDEYFIGTSEEYLEINNVAYDAIKAIDPNAIVWAPGVVIWADTLVSTGSNLRIPEPGEVKYNQYLKLWELIHLLLNEGKFDGFSFHVYGSDEHVYKITRALKLKLAANPAHAQKKLLLSETNLPVGIPWENCPYNSISETEQARTLEQRYACSFNAGVDIALWFPIRDRINNNCLDQNLRDGIIRQDYSKKPAFNALTSINQKLAEANPTCAGVTINTIQENCSPKGLQTTLSWNAVPQASQYVIAFDDDPDFWLDKNAGREVGESPAWAFSNTDTWSRIFPDGRQRYFMVRIGQSMACLPNTSAYGVKKASMAQACFASDVNFDGKVDFADFAFIKNNFASYSIFNLNQIIIKFNITH